MRFSCGGMTREGTIQVSSETGWPIQDQSFVAETSVYAVTGAFTPDFSTVNGTWQGIISDWGGTEICRGPVGSWSATSQP